MEKKPPKKSKKDKKPPLYNYAHYLGIGFRIMGTVLAGVLIGYLLDSYMGNQTNYFTLIFSLAALIIMLYQLIKEFS